MKTLGAKAYVWGEERCPTTNKLHLQAYVEFRSEKRFETIKRVLPKAHLEMCKGSRQDNIEYCTKDATNIVRVGLPQTELELAAQRKEEVRQYFENKTWRPWQQAIIDELDGPRDERKIIWVYEETGGVGKTLLSQYLHWKHDAVLATGKKADVFNQVYEHSKKHLHVSVAVMDIPREVADMVHYGTIECIKNGMLFSGKYEGGCWSQSRDNAAHILCLANTPPKVEKLSKDRWAVYKIVDEQLVEEKQERAVYGNRGGNEYFDYL